jgi:hypothetical protein
MQGTVQGPTQRAADLRVPNSPDETQAVTLSGNVHSQARPEFDRGFVNAETRLDRMLLLLKASPAQQSDLDALVEAQQNPASPLYHRWLTPAEYGARFGVSAQDMSRVRAWLEGHGFTVIEIPAGNRLVLFSGTAGQVFDTFHTEIHRYRVEGMSHIANSLDPQIPVALVVERTGGLGQGSANAELYSLVNAERNPFHATQSGNNSVPGVAGFWANGATYNLATGLGSVDGAALAGIWGSGSGALPTLKLTAASNMVSVTAGGSTTMSFSAITGGSFAGDIGLSMGGLRSGLTAVWSANPITPTSSVSTNAVTLTVTASSLAAQGNYSFMVTAAGDSLVSTQSVTVQVQKQRACFGLLRALRLPCGAPAPVRLQIPKMERSREDQ